MLSTKQRNITSIRCMIYDFIKPWLMKQNFHKVRFRYDKLGQDISIWQKAHVFCHVISGFICVRIGGSWHPVAARLWRQMWISLWLNLFLPWMWPNLPNRHKKPDTLSHSLTEVIYYNKVGCSMMDVYPIGWQACAECSKIYTKVADNTLPEMSHR